MKKIKVMRIITRLNIGGPAIHTILLNEGLNGNEYTSYLVTGMSEEDEGDMTCLAHEKGLVPITIPKLKRQINIKDDITAFLKIFHLIRKERPDIVHTHMAKAGTLGRLASICLGVPVKVHTLHGHVFHSYFNPVNTGFFLLIERLLARFTDRIIVVGDTLKEEICDRFRVTDANKISVIKLGLELDKFTQVDGTAGSLRKELNIDKKIMLVGIVGRLAPVKNHVLFIDAIKLLRDDNPDLNVKFLVIGDGKLKGKLEDRVLAAGLADWVLFIGWRDNMPEIYAELDIVVLTSMNEGTPLCLIEAMSSQRAVIATQVGGLPDLIKHRKTGLLVKLNDATQLKCALDLLLNDSELRAKLGQAACKFVRERYSKERLINDVETLYQELLREKKKQHT